MTMFCCSSRSVIRVQGVLIAVIIVGQACRVLGRCSTSRGLPGDDDDAATSTPAARAISTPVVAARHPSFSSAMTKSATTTQQPAALILFGTHAQAPLLYYIVVPLHQHQHTALWQLCRYFIGQVLPTCLEIQQRLPAPSADGRVSHTRGVAVTRKGGLLFQNTTRTARVKQSPRRLPGSKEWPPGSSWVNDWHGRN